MIRDYVTPKDRITFDSKLRQRNQLAWFPVFISIALILLIIFFVVEALC